MTAGMREQIARVLGEHQEDYDSDCDNYSGCSCGWDNGDWRHNDGYTEHVADALTPLIREAEERGARAALAAAADDLAAYPSRSWVIDWLRVRAEQTGADRD